MVPFYGIDWTMSRKGSGLVVRGVPALDRWWSIQRGSRDGHAESIQERYSIPIWQL